MAEEASLGTAEETSLGTAKKTSLDMADGMNVGWTAVKTPTERSKI